MFRCTIGQLTCAPQFSPCSLGVFPERSRFRQWVIWCITWKRFDQFILLLILTNSIILALADYSHVDLNGDLLASGSLRNSIVKYSDNVFTTLFSVECTLKIIAMGFFGDQGAYLMDPWNWVDFVVVVLGSVSAEGLYWTSNCITNGVCYPVEFLR